MCDLNATGSTTKYHLRIFRTKFLQQLGAGIWTETDISITTIVRCFSQTKNTGGGHSYTARVMSRPEISTAC